MQSQEPVNIRCYGLYTATVSNLLSGLSAADVLKVVAGGLLPFFGALVAAAIAWAKDLNGDARRMRAIDEMTKRVEFWDKWRASLEALNVLTEEQKEEAVAKTLESGSVVSRIGVPETRSQRLIMRILWPRFESGQFETHLQVRIYRSLIAAAALSALIWLLGPETLNISPKYGLLRRPLTWLFVWLAWAACIRLVAYISTQVPVMVRWNERMKQNMERR